VLFKFRTIIILLTLCAHTHLEVNFNFSMLISQINQPNNILNRISQIQ
jgi:hypothetical protein